MPSYEREHIKNHPELFTFVKPMYVNGKTQPIEFQLRYGGKGSGFYFTWLVDDEYSFFGDWDNSRDRVVGMYPFIRELLWEYIEVRKIKSVAKWNLVRISYLILMVYGVLDTNSDKFKQLFAVGRRAKPSMLYKCLVKLKEDNIV